MLKEFFLQRDRVKADTDVISCSDHWPLACKDVQRAWVHIVSPPYAWYDYNHVILQCKYDAVIVFNAIILIYKSLPERSRMRRFEGPCANTLKGHVNLRAPASLRQLSWKLRHVKLKQTNHKNCYLVNHLSQETFFLFLHICQLHLTAFFSRLIFTYINLLRGK